MIGCWCLVGGRWLSVVGRWLSVVGYRLSVKLNAQTANKTTKQPNNTIDIALQKHSYYLVIA